ELADTEVGRRDAEEVVALGDDRHARCDQVLSRGAVVDVRAHERPATAPARGVVPGGALVVVEVLPGGVQAHGQEGRRGPWRRAPPGPGGRARARSLPSPCRYLEVGSDETIDDSADVLLGDVAGAPRVATVERGHEPAIAAQSGAAVRLLMVG